MTADIQDVYEELIDIEGKLDDIRGTLDRQADALERIAERFENFNDSDCVDDFYGTAFSKLFSGIRNELKRIADKLEKKK